MPLHAFSHTQNVVVCVLVCLLRYAHHNIYNRPHEIKSNVVLNYNEIYSLSLMLSVAGLFHLFSFFLFALPSLSSWPESKFLDLFVLFKAAWSRASHTLIAC
jgi:hypothetical protein